MQRRRNGKRRAVRSALMLAGVTAGMVFGSVSPTQAAVEAPPEPCPFDGVLCLYDGSAFAGDRWNVTSLDPNGTCVSLVEHGWGDRARSAINTNSKGAAMFMNDGCIGDPFQVPGNSSIIDFGSFRPNSVWVPK